MLAQAAPPQDPNSKPQERLALLLSEWQKQKNEEKLRSAGDTPYQKWLTEDVAYIIADKERIAFKALQTDEEREKFIEQFWLRRDPTPGTFENEFREEHYRRIAYANEHFSASIPGWKTDRGRVYISYGPPDEIESHPSGGTYRRPPEEGGDTITTVPFEQWRYRYIEGIGRDIIVEFVDPDKTGDYRMTADPNERDAAATRATKVGTGATVQVLGTAVAGGKAAVLITIPLKPYENQAVNLLVTITSNTRRPVMTFGHTIQGPTPTYSQFVSLAPGSYRLSLVFRDVAAGALAKDEIEFEVK